MGDTSISIVPRQSVFPNRENKAQEILQWLVSIDIVRPTPTDCILSSNDGYPISEGAKFVVAEAEYLPFSLWTNGLEIITERQVFHTGQNGIERLICPNCKQDISK